MLTEAEEEEGGERAVEEAAAKGTGIGDGIIEEGMTAGTERERGTRAADAAEAEAGGKKGEEGGGVYSVCA